MIYSLVYCNFNFFSLFLKVNAYFEMLFTIVDELHWWGNDGWVSWHLQVVQWFLLQCSLVDQVKSTKNKTFLKNVIYNKIYYVSQWVTNTYQTKKLHVRILVLLVWLTMSASSPIGTQTRFLGSLCVRNLSANSINLCHTYNTQPN